MSHPRLLALAAVTAAVAAGCGSSAPVAAQKWRTLQIAVPAQVGGLDTHQEDSRVLSTGGADSLLDAGEIVSFRSHAQLLATLEIGELISDVNPADPTFQAAVINQIGNSILEPQTIGTQTVYTGRGNSQLVYVWFKKRLMHVLLTHDIADPSALVTALLVLP